MHLRRSGPEATDAEPASPAPNMVGVAFSGGGIRSATISLGILQGLARVGLLRFVDYVSSVSGGGYVSTYLGGLFLRWKTEAGATRAHDWERVAAALEDSKGHPVDWLRENGRYLAPNGAGDLSVAVAVVLRNLVAVHVVLGVTFVTALLAANGLRRLVTRSAELGSPGSAARLQEIFVQPDMWWSPLIVLPTLVIVFWALPMGLAYWLVRTDEKDGKADGTEAWAPALTVVLLAVLAVLGLATADRFGTWGQFVSRLSLAALLISGPTLVAWFLSLRLPVPPGGGAGGKRSVLRRILEPSHTSASARSFLTFRLRSALLVLLATAAFALVDSLGQTIFVRWEATGELKQMARWVGGGFTTLATLATIAQRFGGLFNQATKERPKVPAAILATVAAAVLVGVMLISLATLAHAMTWADPPLCSAAGQPPRLCVPESIVPARYFTCLGLGLFLTLAFGRMYSFVNRSSLAALYGARLARAYLGASSAARAGDAGKSLATLLDDDDLDLASYLPHLRGGPLHLINVTVNETTAGRSQVEQRDRKGMGMAIGPAGVSVGVRHHARWAEFGTNLIATAAPSLDPATGIDDEHMFRVFPRTSAPFSPRWPTVGRWMAISGAAVSTGLGSRTSLSLSLLIGLFNLRLGHWWRSGVDPADRISRTARPSWLGRVIGGVARLLPVQSHLLSELLARFPGTSSPDWYLTDGGHFENTGAYELIRRRLPLIVVCDNGADDGTFDDLGNLVRKARTDFGASIAFLRPPELREIFAGSSPIGSLEDLGFREPTGWQAAESGADQPPPGAPPSGRACRYAAIARVTYADDDKAMSILLLIRPAVLGGEPADILSYHAKNPAFPQQSTANQFFDEAQWESYRRLGELMACTVFSHVAPAEQAPTEEGWRPFPAKLYQRPSDDCSSN